MANCAMVVDDLGNSTSTMLQAALQNKGHTVTEIQVGTVTETSLEIYDSIFLPRTTPSTTVAAHLRNYIQQGIPVWGGLRAPQNIKMGTYDTVGSTSAKPRAFDVNHWLFLGMPIGDIAVHSSTTFRLMPGITTEYCRSLTTCVDGSTTRRPDGLLFLPHTNDSDGVPFGGICGLMCWIYAQSAFTANGEEAVHRLATLKPARISGTIAGSDEAVKVRIIDRITGEIISETQSDPVTGEWETWTVAGREVNVIALSDDVKVEQNDQVQRVIA